MARQILILIVCSFLASCAEMQVKRDIGHAHEVQQYIAATASGKPFEPASLCAPSPAFKAWATFEFSQTSTIYSLPNGINAEATCLTIPAGAKAIELHGMGSQSGLTYHEATAIHPSILFLDKDYKTVVDLQQPRLSAGEGLFTGLGVSGIVPLVTKLSMAKYAVIYIHPKSTDGAIEVYTNKTIPVPYGPYGTVRARFFE